MGYLINNASLRRRDLDPRFRVLWSDEGIFQSCCLASLQNVLRREPDMKAIILNKKNQAILVCLLFSTLWCQFSVAQDKTFATIDLNALRTKSTKVQAAIQEVRKTELDAQAQLQQLASEVAEIEKKLKEGKDTLKKEEQEKLESDLRAKQETLNNETQVARIRVSFKRRSAENSINQEVTGAIAKVAKAAGFKVVFHERALAYAEDLPDITEKVIAALDAATSPTKSEAKPEPGAEPKSEQKAEPKAEPKAKTKNDKEKK
jgi:Skp family chaperone for outer membrane proteins